jgi:Family of unknown function (DUF6159)
MGKFARAWALTKQSGAVLMADKRLLVFPLLSSIAAILVLATFALPIALSVDWNALAESKGGPKERVQMEWWYYGVLLLYYFANFFVITFFNSALVACALKRFAGEPAGPGEGLKVAVSRLPQIAAWSAVSATVGVVLQALQERAGFLGKIVLNMIGMVWTIATFFVVPVLVVEKVGPFEALKRSVGVLKKTWGESLVVNVGMSAVSMLLVLVGLLLFVGGGIGLTIATHHWAPIAIGGVLMIVWVTLLALVFSALKGIFLAATYQYATTGVVPGGFDQGTLAQAFAMKGKK